MTTSAPYKLPAGWSWAALKDVADIVGGLTKGQKVRTGAETRAVPYLRVANVQRGYLNLSEVKTIEATEQDIQALRLQPGDILFNEGGDRDKLGRGWIWEGQLPECIHQNHVFRARLVLPEVAPQFISWWGNSYGQEWFMKAGKQSVNLASISLSNLRNFPVPIAPAAEQARIIDALEELLSDLDAGVEALRQAQAKLNYYRAAVLKAAVEGRLTAEWRKRNPVTESASELLKYIHAQRRLFWEQEQLRKFADLGKEPPTDWQSKYSEPIESDTSDRPRLPSGWRWATVDQIGHIQGGLQKTPGRAPILNHYPYLRVANVQRGKVDLRKLSRFELTEQELLQLVLRRGDLLIVEGNGSRTEIGRCALWRGEVENCVHQNHIIRIRLWSGIVPEYANLFFNSPIGQQEIQRVASSTSGLYTLSISKVARLALPLPALSEQEAIVNAVSEQLSMIDHVSSDLDSKSVAAQALRQSILHRAFTGQLVHQNPNDEPAEEILKRIAAERAHRPISMSRRRSKNK